MKKAMFAIGIAAVLVSGTVLVPADVYARSNSGHAMGAGRSFQAGVSRSFGHARRSFYPHRGVIFLAPRYYEYGYVPTEEVAPPPIEHAAPEKRRTCEPQIYTVPSASGGESQITVIRC